MFFLCQNTPLYTTNERQQFCLASAAYVLAVQGK